MSTSFRTAAIALGSLLFAFPGAGCGDPCVDAPAPELRAADGEADPGPHFRIAVTGEGLSRQLGTQRTRARGARRTTKIEAGGGRRTAVASAGAPAALLVDDDRAPDDCPSCALLRVRMQVELGLGDDPLVGAPSDDLGQARTSVILPVRLELVPSPEGGGVRTLVAQADPTGPRPLVAAPAQLPRTLDEALVPAFRKLVDEVAKVEGAKFAGTALLRVRGWPVTDGALGLTDVSVAMVNREVILEASPAANLPGPSLAEVDFVPGPDQDLSWGISAGWLAAIADDGRGLIPPLMLDGVDHELRVTGVGPSTNGVSVGLRARRTDGCGWFDATADPVKSTSGNVTVRVLEPESVVHAGSGGQGFGSLDAGAAAAVGQHAQALLQERLGHPLVLGPAGQAPQVVMVRHDREAGAVVVDTRFPRAPLNRPRPVRRPPRPDEIQELRLE